jgi:hypothetical protein
VREESPRAIVTRWKDKPPLDPSAWAKYDGLAATRESNGQFQVALYRLFSDAPHILEPWKLKEYRAIPLAKYLESRGAAIGTGDHLVVTNLRGERLYLTRQDVTRYAPEIVIGIDGEANLYRIATTYRLEREYSWRTSPKPPAMIRPVGPFLFFRDGVPPELDDTTTAGFCLEPDSFRFQTTDALAPVRGAPADVLQAFTGVDGCLKCHSFRGTGARSHHLRASDGRAHGGFALPLEEYPPPVLHAFLFDQERVSMGFGVTPLTIEPTTAAALEKLVRER